MTNAFIVDRHGEATDIFQWDQKEVPPEIRVFHSDDIEELLKVKSFFRIKKEKLSYDIVAQMRKLRDDMDLLPLKDMMLKYIGEAPCCVSKIDAILNAL